MISASTQTLATLLASNPLWVERETISFEHPQIARRSKPCLNVYCYHIQAVSGDSRPALTQSYQQSYQQREKKSDRRDDCQWFELTFLLSVFDYTTLGEQHLFSTILSALSSCRAIPEDLLAPSLKGWGDLPLSVSTPNTENSLQLWKVLGAPIRLSLHVKLAVPASCSNVLTPA